MVPTSKASAKGRAANQRSIERQRLLIPAMLTLITMRPPSEVFGQGTRRRLRVQEARSLVRMLWWSLLYDSLAPTTIEGRTLGVSSIV
mmetsp:Transcript_42788/g.125667  ORF Transcript_42788/g.125667 Transcript_42788/m.125667 type:complete len:88 (-) Transcript_42788:289-552(-)